MYRNEANIKAAVGKSRVKSFNRQQLYHCLSVTVEFHETSGLVAHVTSDKSILFLHYRVSINLYLQLQCSNNKTFYTKKLSAPQHLLPHELKQISISQNVFVDKVHFLSSVLLRDVVLNIQQQHMVCEEKN
jgi:hypothetical protein